MSEHAFDPTPDEESESPFIRRGNAIAVDAPIIDETPKPNAVVTLDQVLDAVKAKRWAHDNDSTALWLNTAFPITSEDPDALIEHLGAHGIIVE